MAELVQQHAARVATPGRSQIVRGRLVYTQPAADGRAGTARAPHRHPAAHGRHQRRVRPTPATPRQRPPRGVRSFTAPFAASPRGQLLPVAASAPASAAGPITAITASSSRNDHELE